MWVANPELSVFSLNSERSGVWSTRISPNSGGDGPYMHFVKSGEPLPGLCLSYT